MNWELFRLEKMAEVAETMVIPIELAMMAEVPFVSISEDVLVFVPDLSSVHIGAGDSDSVVLLWRSNMVEECHKYLFDECRKYLFDEWHKYFLLDECHMYLLEGCQKYFFSDS